MGAKRARFFLRCAAGWLKRENKVFWKLIYRAGWWGWFELMGKWLAACLFLCRKSGFGGIGFCDRLVFGRRLRLIGSGNIDYFVDFGSWRTAFVGHCLFLMFLWRGYWSVIIWVWWRLFSWIRNAIYESSWIIIVSVYIGPFSMVCELFGCRMRPNVQIYTYFFGRLNMNEFIFGLIT